MRHDGSYKCRLCYKTKQKNVTGRMGDVYFKIKTRNMTDRMSVVYAGRQIGRTRWIALVLTMLEEKTKEHDGSYKCRLC